MCEAAVPLLSIVASQPFWGAVYPQYEGLSVGVGLVCKKPTQTHTRLLERICFKTANSTSFMSCLLSGVLGSVLFCLLGWGGLSRCFPHADYQVASTKPPPTPPLSLWQTCPLLCHLPSASTQLKKKGPVLLTSTKQKILSVCVGARSILNLHLEAVKSAPLGLFRGSMCLLVKPEICAVLWSWWDGCFLLGSEKCARVRL